VTIGATARTLAMARIRPRLTNNPVLEARRGSDKARPWFRFMIWIPSAVLGDRTS